LSAGGTSIPVKRGKAALGRGGGIAAGKVGERPHLLSRTEWEREKRVLSTKQRGKKGSVSWK